jgi:hypothetical protein
MTDKDLPDINLYGLEELIDDIYGLPDISTSTNWWPCWNLLELPDKISQMTLAWPW